ncbi:hypothetical protein V1527DRAFT_516603 [Lipomyces starkeyi]
MGKRSETFWRESTRKLSQEWSSHITTASAGLGLSSVSGSSSSMESSSWFSINVHPQTSTRLPNAQKNFSPSIITSSQNRTGGGGNKIRARKILLFPTTSQKKTVRQWFGAQRYIYNKCVALVREEMKPSQKELRAVLRNSEANTLDYKLKDEAIRDFMENYKSNMAKYRKDKKPFTMKFRSKQAPTQSLSVLKKKWNRGEGSFFSSIFSVTASEPLPAILAMDSRLLRKRSGRYFPITPNKGKEKRKSATLGVFVFIDPGVRTFLTCYDSNENIVEVGRGAVVRVSKLLHHRRKLQGLAALRNHKKRQNLRRSYIRLGERINHLVEDMHKKAATFLCANYDSILLPKLNFHTCRNLNRKSKSCMATLGHCASFDRTAMKAENCGYSSTTDTENAASSDAFYKEGSRD